MFRMENALRRATKARSKRGIGVLSRAWVTAELGL
jgi:hypothetical protein